MTKIAKTAAAVAGVTGLLYGASPQVKMETTLGDITIELDAVKAPKTVANFLEYVNSGFYDGTIFHRVIGGFMIQGGGFTEDMSQKPTRDPIANEADNGLKNLRGTLAMARTGDPHSATAQFFINLVDNGFLNFKAKDEQSWGYCVFGKVIKGIEVVDAIAKSETSNSGMFQNVPVTPILIKKATVVKASAKPTKKQPG
jgi:cyclophilin family peptidyl-prolyl cis-trans isomerase